MRSSTASRAGAQIRKNAVRAIEAMFSLHPGAHVDDERAYFADCLEWARQHFGIVLSADVRLQ